MIDDDEQYEAECERIQQANAQLLADFEMWLIRKNLAVKTIKNHIDNKEELPEWVETLERYDDPDITDMDEVWGF